MFQGNSEWNPLQSKLKEIILKKEKLPEVKELLISLHSIVHCSIVYEKQDASYMDEIWEGLDDIAFRAMPTSKDDTIAWNIWHITRIEDLTSNFLIKGQNQVLDDAWMERMKVSIKDTGNAMSDPELIDFSNKIDKKALYEYRNAVGLSTKGIIEGLKPEDMKRKVSKEGLEKIMIAGGVTEQADSIWLLDFWGRKNIAGIFLMPITRHQLVHLNDCKRLKLVCNKSIRTKKEK